MVGNPEDPGERSALEVTAEERREAYEAGWAEGGFNFIFAFNDLITDRRANDTAGEFIRSKIREIVKDPETVEKLLPTDQSFFIEAWPYRHRLLRDIQPRERQPGRYSPLTNPRDHAKGDTN